MDKKKKRKNPFGFKELRLSIAHMVLWSLLAVAFFTYLTIELGEKIERNYLYFIIVLSGYVIIVVVLTMLFTHRLIGPFERLKTELKIVQSGEYHRRLTIRGKDDLYIRSFIFEVDKLLDKLEKMHYFREYFRKKIISELSDITSLIERNEISREELKGTIISFHEKVEDLLKDRDR